jgi:hypothetical protein
VDVKEGKREEDKKEEEDGGEEKLMKRKAGWVRADELSISKTCPPIYYRVY